MNHVIESIYASGECVSPEGVRYPVFPAGIKRNEGEALYGLVRELNACRTLEVGMAWGLSALFLCQGHKDAGHPPIGLDGRAAHTAVDPFQVKGFHSMGVHNLEKAGLGKYVRFVEESSHTALPRMVKEGEKFDLIFIDGCHLFDAALVDFFFADQLVEAGGHLVFDDLWMPAVRKVLGFVLSNRAYRIAEERLPALGDLGAAKAADEAYRERKKGEGKGDKGALPESRFHLYRNINWTVLQKFDGDKREWDHFEGSW
jgi:predicted O-methyltransferase YrrM